MKMRTGTRVIHIVPPMLKREYNGFFLFEKIYLYNAFYIYHTKFIQHNNILFSILQEGHRAGGNVYPKKIRGTSTRQYRIHIKLK